LSNQVNTTLIAAYTSSEIDTSGRQVLASPTLNITLSDGQGNSITQLDSPLTICLVMPNTTKKAERVCLSFFDEIKKKWRCEDECLTNIATKGANDKGGTEVENLLCGQTGHLTNFALLLVGSDGQDPCQSSKDNTLAWVSLGLVAVAIVVVALSGLVVEARIRWRLSLLNNKLKRAAQHTP
jgi:hypothetical protein